MSIGSALPTYQDLTIASPSILKRWAHRRRYAAALAAVDIPPDCAILDYGAGDGHLLVNIASREAGTELWAFEPCPYANIAAARLGRRVRILAQAARLPDAYFDLAFCTEVLEHLDEAALDGALRNLARVMKPGGRTVLTVPVEIGPASLVKNAVRSLIGERHAGGGIANIVRSLLGHATSIPRAHDDSGYIASHVGFDYRRLPPLIAAHGLAVERWSASPLPWAWPGLNSQMLYVLRHAPGSPPARSASSIAFNLRVAA